MPAAPWLPVLALMLNALVWGVSWWPFRHLQRLGVHPLWATVLIFGAAVLAIVATRPRAVAELFRRPVLWVLVLAAGSTNASFNWGIVIGDVVRVVLLFYLMPLWSALLSRLLLTEPLGAGALLRIVLSVLGAGIVLWPAGGFADGGLPWPRSLPDWLGVIGGMTFALNNVMLRRDTTSPAPARALAMFLGGLAVAGVLATLLASRGEIPWPAWSARADWFAPAAALALLFLCSNLALQYGASRLPSHVTSVVMLCEVVFASVSSALLDDARFTPPLLAGGALIVASALLAAMERPRAGAVSAPA